MNIVNLNCNGGDVVMASICQGEVEKLSTGIGRVAALSDGKYVFTRDFRPHSITADKIKIAGFHLVPYQVHSQEKVGSQRTSQLVTSWVLHSLLSRNHPQAQHISDHGVIACQNGNFTVPYSIDPAVSDMANCELVVGEDCKGQGCLHVEVIRVGVGRLMHREVGTLDGSLDETLRMRTVPFLESAFHLIDRSLTGNSSRAVAAHSVRDYEKEAFFFPRAESPFFSQVAVVIRLAECAGMSERVPSEATLRSFRVIFWLSVHRLPFGCGRFESE